MTAVVAHRLLGLMSVVSASAERLADDALVNDLRECWSAMMTDAVAVLADALRCLAAGHPDAALECLDGPRRVVAAVHAA